MGGQREQPPLVAHMPGMNALFLLLLSMATAVLWRVLGWAICTYSPSMRSLRTKAVKSSDAAKFPKNTAGLLHAVYCTVHGLYYFLEWSFYDPVDMYNCGASVWHTWRIAWCSGIMGYLIQDLLLDLDLARRRIVPLEWGMVVHHVVFLAQPSMLLVYEKGCYVYCWQMCSEGTPIEASFASRSGLTCRGRALL